MWALAIYDLKQNQLVLSRDRYGKKPLYYYKDSEKIIFASEIKSSEVSGIPKKPNKRKLVNYCFRHYRYVDNDCESFFEGIMQVPKAEWMKIHSDGSIKKTYFGNLNPFCITLHKKRERNHRGIHASVRASRRIENAQRCSGGGILEWRNGLYFIGFDCVKMNPNFQTISGVTGKGYYDESEYIKEVVEFTGVSSEFVYPKPKSLPNHFGDVDFSRRTDLYGYLVQHVSNGQETSKYDISVILTGHGEMNYWPAIGIITIITSTT